MDPVDPDPDPQHCLDPYSYSVSHGSETWRVKSLELFFIDMPPIFQCKVKHLSTSLSVSGTVLLIHID